ncbi:MAG TPA: hypothetical protein VGJ86_14455, partial [Acidimicrobiales bacterium]
MLGFSLLILFLGIGVSVKGWRIWSAWRSVAAVAVAVAVAVAATAAAAAAADTSGLDEATFRSTDGQTIQLDPATAEELANASVDVDVDVDVDVAGLLNRT